MRIYLVGKNANGQFALIAKTDFELVKNHKWYDHGTGYAYTKINGKTIMMHRLILNASKGQAVDHRNRNGLDNTRKNIRLCTMYENNIYRPVSKDNKTGYKGVNFNPMSSSKNPWTIYYSFQGHHHYGGSYATKELAAKKYNEIVKKLHGEFAWINKLTKLKTS